MPKITIINRTGQETVYDADSGLSLMENIREAGFSELLALCGGNRACATCHVYIDPKTQGVTPPTLDESELLAISPNLTERSRLSCQVTVSDDMEGLRVELAPLDD